MAPVPIHHLDSTATLVYIATSMQSNITDIAYQQIKGDYYWARYGDFKVIMNKSNGYINATKLCQLGGNSKELKNWTANSTSNSLIKEVSSVVGVPTPELLMIVAGGRIIEIRGTYAHPELIPHIAYWASPKFAVAVMRIVNKFMIERDAAHRILRTSPVGDTLREQLVSRAVLRDDITNAQLPADRPLQCVYFIRSGEYTKIGYTGDLTHRLSTLQVGNPVQLEVVHTVLTRYAEQLEADLHAKFSDYRVTGEWFKLPTGALEGIDQWCR